MLDERVNKDILEARLLLTKEQVPFILIIQPGIIFETVPVVPADISCYSKMINLMAIMVLLFCFAHSFLHMGVLKSFYLKQIAARLLAVLLKQRYII